jgi:hypothetical protein
LFAIRPSALCRRDGFTANFAEQAAGIFPDLDAGLEWTVEKALGQKDRRTAADEPVALESLELVRNFDAAEIATWRSIPVPRDFVAARCYVGKAMQGIACSNLTQSALMHRIELG